MSRDPIRLRHDPAIRTGLRDDLALARRGARVPYDEAQGLARLQASLGGGPGSGGAPPQGPPANVMTIPWGAAAIGAGAAAIVLALANWLAPAADPSFAAAPRGLESAAALAPPPLPLASSIPALDPREIASSRPLGAPPRPAAQVASAAPASEARSPAPSPTVEATASAAKASPEATLAEEVAHLARARTLAASDPASALGLIEEGHRRFPGGALWLERETIAFNALMRLGRRDEAATRGARIVERYPDSLNARNIQSALGQTRSP